MGLKFEPSSAHHHTWDTVQLSLAPSQQLSLMSPFPEKPWVFQPQVAGAGGPYSRILISAYSVLLLASWSGRSQDLGPWKLSEA